MNIFLIGFMGCGKSTVGRDLARLLNYEFVDMDDYIVDKQGQSIADIFDTYGESFFRGIEKDTIAALCKQENTVVGTGGGAPCFFDNMEVINRHAVSVYLQLTPDEFVRRVYNPNTERPLLRGKNKEQLSNYYTEMLAKRAPFYQKASVIVDATIYGPKKVAELIKLSLNIS